MITSKLQYNASQEALTILKNTLETGFNPDWGDALVEATKHKTQRKIADIEAVITEYEYYTSGEVTHIPIFSLDDLKKSPIRYRLMMNETVNQFASEVGISKRQILRYEEEQYENCSMSTFNKIMEKIQSFIEGWKIEENKSSI